MVRRPAAVADALFLPVVVFQGIARARPAKDAAAPPAVVPPSRHREDALAAEAGLRGGVGDPELFFVGVGAHFRAVLVLPRELIVLHSYTGIGSARNCWAHRWRSRVVHYLRRVCR